ncbi:MAG: hypothetical protein QGG40_01460, partial [Myxococcota bacterium]|nr:hypothetical protein [Myxococcota bacterium]
MPLLLGLLAVLHPAHATESTLDSLSELRFQQVDLEPATSTFRRPALVRPSLAERPEEILHYLPVGEPSPGLTCPQGTEVTIAGWCPHPQIPWLSRSLVPL